MKKYKTIAFGAAMAVCMTAAAGAAKAEHGFWHNHFTHHEFDEYPTADLSDSERLELERYLNYEEREQCQRYRKAPSPFHRNGCDLIRGERLEYTFYFDTASSTVRGSDAYKLDKIAKAVKMHNPREVQIIGYTDTQGNEEYNRKLSQRRADAVQGRLQARGISSSILDEEAMGEHGLAVQTADGVANQSNRRVTVRLLK